MFIALFFCVTTISYGGRHRISLTSHTFQCKRYISIASTEKCNNVLDPFSRKRSQMTRYIIPMVGQRVINKINFQRNMHDTFREYVFLYAHISYVSVLQENRQSDLNYNLGPSM